MFEKDAEEIMRQNGCRTHSGNFIQADKVCELIQKGAEFGYNKANEWQFVSEKGLPKHEKDVQVLYQDCNKKNVYNCVYDIHAENWLYYDLVDMVLELFPFNVIAWKEIVPPKESE